ncbi:MAG: sodium:solute symporter family protein [Verrucomicrobiae bacterium]|nr:sodium:solute symporter family protein [Verrucomicrobiae bacterium]
MIGILAQVSTVATGEPVLGTSGLIFIGIYCCLLLLIGWLGHRAKKENTLADFYLGGRGLGFAVLLLTLYATQYSGNTLMGFAGDAYRNGFNTLSIVMGMMSIIGAYFIYAPKLYRLSHSRGYITMGDYLTDRFHMRSLTVCAVILGIVALCNYILTNMLVLGKLVVWLSGGGISFTTGVIVLAVIMVAYEFLGGMRSVAWTDMMQGLILLLGVTLIFGAIFYYNDGVTGMIERLHEHKPQALVAPTAAENREWWSRIVLFFFGISMYPHAIQRVYSAKSEQTLKRSLQFMVFLPLITTLLMVLLGVIGAGKFPGLDKTGSDRITLLMLQDLAQTGNSGLSQALVVLFVAAIIAATMSTIDSALLAISSLITKDIYQPLRPSLSQDQLTAFGKGSSIVLMAVTVGFAIWLQDATTIMALIKLKLELLCQIAPAFFLGLHWRLLRGSAVLAGLLTGTATAVLMKQFGVLADSGISPGLYGLAMNVIVLLVVQALLPVAKRTSL